MSVGHSIHSSDCNRVYNRWQSDVIESVQVQMSMAHSTPYAWVGSIRLNRSTRPEARPPAATRLCVHEKSPPQPIWLKCLLIVMPPGG